MSRFWNWLTVADAKPKVAQPSTVVNKAIVNYTSRLETSIVITGDVDYVLKLLPIVTKQLEAADGRLTGAA